MNLLPYLKKLSAEEIKCFKELTSIKRDNILDIYSSFTAYLEKNITRYLSKLSSIETYIFYLTINHPGYELESNKEFELASLYEAVKSLKKKALVFTKKSVQKVKPVTKVFLFQEVMEIIERKLPLYTLKDLIKKMKNTNGMSIDYSYHDMPDNMFQFFYSYGFIARSDFLNQQFGNASVHYFLEEGILNEALVMVFEKGKYQFYPCYEIKKKNLKEKSIHLIRSISFHTRIFNDIIRLIYIITKEDIKITKKGEINKKQYDKLYKEINSENILWFLINFFTKHRFIEFDEENNYITLTEKGYHFFKQDIKDVYHKILRTDPFLNEIFSMIEKMSSKDFGLADIILEYLKEHIEDEPGVYLLRETRRNIMKYVEILTYMGILIQKFTADGFVVYSYNPRYMNLVNDVKGPSRPILISPSMEVTVYPQELDLQTSYYLNIFMDIKNFSDIFTYQITPRSIRRALYFGFSIQDLIKVLKKRSRKNIPSNILINIERWAEQFKTGKISEKLILRAPKDVLDLLEHQIDYQELIIERVSEELAIVSEDIYKKRILEEISVYLYPEK